MELNAIESLVKELVPDPVDPNNTYNAVVSQIDNDGTVWVNVAGGTIDTPTASKSSEVEVGDNVTVEWRANKLYISGNASNPSAGSARVDVIESTAEQARTAAQSAVQDAGIAREAAESAQADAQSASTAATQAQNSLKSVVQGATTVEKAVSVMQTALEAIVDYDPTEDEVQEYFWHDANGAHVLGNTSGYRNDISSIGMKIMDVNTETRVSEFGDFIILGKDDESHAEVDYHSLKLIDKEGKTYFWVSDLRDREGKVTEYFIGDGVTRRFRLTGSADSYTHEDVTITIDGEETTAWDVDRYEFVFNVAPETGSIIAIKYLPLSTGSLILPTQLKGYSFGNRKENSTIGGYSVVEGDDNVASGYASHAEGQNTKASGDRSHAEGTNTIASSLSSHAEGYQTTASGQDSHAEGNITTASGVESHAEGYNATASGYVSHSEGSGTTASGYFSHAEGYESVASGRASHAGGYKTISQRAFQTVIGKSNIADTDGADEMNEGKYVLIIGNGSVFIPSNALTVDWNGNVDIADGAKYKINGTDLAPSDLGEADYVVEQGTSGGWYYRKWDSGRLDADRVWNVGQVTLNTAEGTTHRVSADLTIPTPSMMIGGTVEASYVGNSSNSPSFIEKTTNNKLRIAKVITSNVTLQNVTIALRLVGGTWK